VNIARAQCNTFDPHHGSRRRRFQSSTLLEGHSTRRDSFDVIHCCNYESLDAAPFIGEWTLDLQGPDGPGAFDLIVEKEKVTGEITGGTIAAQPIASVTKADQSLVLSYSFTYENNPVDAAVRLTPAPEGKMNAQVSFAGGAYIMSGTTIKKEKAK
jgi:hypothetical protein